MPVRDFACAHIDILDEYICTPLNAPQDESRVPPFYFLPLYKCVYSKPALDWLHDASMRNNHSINIKSQYEIISCITQEISLYHSQSDEKSLTKDLQKLLNNICGGSTV